jgi:hypothetical protein
MNSIQIVKAIMTAGIQKLMTDSNQIPDGHEEVITVAQELWEMLQLE